MTRVTAPLFIENHFTFKIYRKSILRNIEKFFGAQDVETGRNDFDSEFIIKSNNEYKVKALLQSQEVRNILLTLNEVNLEISDKKGVFEEQLPDDHYNLCYYTDGEITNVAQLKSLLKLFEAMLDKLSEMNIIDSAHR